MILNLFKIGFRGHPRFDPSAPPVTESLLKMSSRRRATWLLRASGRPGEKRTVAWTKLSKSELPAGHVFLEMAPGIGYCSYVAPLPRPPSFGAALAVLFALALGCGGSGGAGPVGGSASGSATASSTSSGTGTIGGTWSVTVLGPTGVDNSSVYGITPTYQAGSANLVGPDQQAVIWHGSSTAVDNLAPPGVANSIIESAQGTAQGGYAVYGTVAHAALWHGTAASFTDLNPTVATHGSSINAVYGNDQGGNWFGSAGERAAMWSGTAGSFHDMAPPGSTNSVIFGMGPGQQVGSFATPTVENGHACVWSGTPASEVDLNGSLDASQAYATDGRHQVGTGDMPGGARSHAMLWSGSASNSVDLNPAGADSSEAHAVSGPYEAGYFFVGPAAYACLWQGTAASFVNLHQLLPPGFTSSYAYSMVQTPTQLFVGGYAVTGSAAVAVIWTKGP